MCNIFTAPTLAIHSSSLWRFDPIAGHGLPLRGFAFTLSGHTTLGRTCLYQSPVRRRRPDDTQHSRQTHVHAPGGIRSERPETHALDCATAAIGRNITYVSAINYEHAQQGTFRQGMHFIPNVCFTHTPNATQS